MSAVQNDHLTNAYNNTLDAVVARIRSTADRIDQHGRVVIDLRNGRPAHNRAAAEVITELQAMIGNLNLYNLLDNAAHAEREWQTIPGLPEGAERR